MTGTYPENVKDEARTWVVRLASGEMSGAEWSRLNTWLAKSNTHKGAFEQERRLWQELAAVEDAFAARDDLSLRRARKTASRPVMIGWAAAAAACLMLAVVAPGAWMNLQTDYAAPTDRVRTVTLSDGSRVALDAGSRIAVDIDAGHRAVTVLQGRAWFDVRHGDARPFTVAARNGVTEDIGTAFEVDMADRAVAVRVSQGEVRVRAKADGPWSNLLAGDGAAYANGSVTPLNGLAAGDVAAWRDGDIVLRDADLNQAIDEIARYRKAPVVVLVDARHVAPVSGNFRSDAPDAALATLAAMRQLNVRSLPGGILLITR